MQILGEKDKSDDQIDSGNNQDLADEMSSLSPIKEKENGPNFEEIPQLNKGYSMIPEYKFN